MCGGKNLVSDIFEGIITLSKDSELEIYVAEFPAEPYDKFKVGAFKMTLELIE